MAAHHTSEPLSHIRQPNLSYTDCGGRDCAGITWLPESDSNSALFLSNACHIGYFNKGFSSLEAAVTAVAEFYEKQMT